MSNLFQIDVFQTDVFQNSGAISQPVSLSPSGGGPMKKIVLEWEERQDCFRLHAHFTMGPWKMDPVAIRFTLYAPDGSPLTTWWPEDMYIERLAIGHFAVSIQPLQVGTWQGRWDAYGEVGSIKTFAFETKVKGQRLFWQEVSNTFGTLPQRAIITR